MQRRAEELHPRRDEKLRHAGAGHVPLDLLAHGQERRQHGGQIERRGDGEGVSEGEEGVAGRGDCARGPEAPRPEQPRELAVLVEAEGHVHAGGGEELGQARGGARGGFVLDGGGESVDGVGREVGAEVEDGDQAEGAGEEEVVRAPEDVG